MNKDIHFDPSDDTTTKLARATTCCDGYHQTIAGAMLGSEEWQAWYEYASERMLFDVDETQEVDHMTGHHFAGFAAYMKKAELQKILEEGHGGGNWRRLIMQAIDNL